jgi:hypothetical protein
MHVKLDDALARAQAEFIKDQFKTKCKEAANAS